MEEIAVVRYAYVTIGAIIFVSSVLFAAAYCQDYIAKCNSAQQQAVPVTQQTTHVEGDMDASNIKSEEHQIQKK